MDLETSARVVIKRVRNRIGRGVGVAGENRDARQRALQRQFGHDVCCRVDISRWRNIKFIDIDQTDIHCDRGEGKVRTGGSHENRMRSRLFAIQRRPICDSHNACHAVDRKSSARVVVQRVGDRIERAVRIRRERGVADSRPVGRIFLNSVGRTVDVSNG